MFNAGVGARRAMAAFGLQVILAGCGGGTDTSAPVTAASSGTALRAAAGALAAAPVSAQDAADMLMDVAEVQYSQYFSGAPTALSVPPFRARYYRSTGTYLGVVVTAGTQYELNGVYVMGGAFGAAPTYVGPLSAFITPVDVSAGGADNGCYDLSVYDGPGNRIVASRTVSSPLGTQTTESLVGEVVNFQGQQVREIAITVAGEYSTSRETVTVKNYSNHTAEGELTSYGSIVQTSRTYAGSTTNETATTVISPPLTDRRYRLAVGESAAQSYSYAKTTSGSSGTGTPTSSSGTVRSIIKYVGREVITVPAGTYETCKFETISPRYSITTEWLIAGPGISVLRVVRTLGQSSLYQTKATAVTLNGQPL
jgi:hypothetical protein